ncbi:uncharacterized protein LOC123671554 [Harmonia axyridis]|uniref:uncharacterized protein LOC123671554 n=1 Tax=Harmonia axyridis TaxID=115357 RepID=UPI001E277BAD|nr:uncharacterized protein LOC123671554 [Harmonia axyridis]XP_045461419.1 uncharacterized protein LOC123671554 [Harmonia axyridis]
MGIRFALFLLLTLGMVTALHERTKRNGAMHHTVSKSGEKIKFTTENKDGNYVTCAPPFYKCCEGASGLLSMVVSEKCLRDDGVPGLCCGSDALTLVEVIFENGTKRMVTVNGGQAENKAKADHIADDIEKIREHKNENPLPQRNKEVIDEDLSALP